MLSFIHYSIIFYHLLLESDSLERLLIQLTDNDIVIMFTFDDASKKLSKLAWLLLNSIGSYSAQNINHRSSWYLITFKGLSGFSPFEQINFSDSLTNWAKPINITTCLPLYCKSL